MGRSWLKFFACGHTATANDASSDEELLPLEKEKASSDKRRWSFRKRSSSLKVINTTVTSDPVSPEYNKSPENAVENFHASKNSPVPEKVPVDEHPLSSPTGISESVDPLVTCSDNSIASHSVEDSVAVVIQTAVRGYFARRELQKLKTVVKLQAAMRGHLVRRHAIGTLRCIHAIIKMQTLVRARQAGKCVKDSAVKDVNLETDSSVNGYSIESDKTCPPKEKLLLNRFACQILECTPKTKQIPIKCVPSRSDSAWKWFERWMTVISAVRKDEITELSANGVQTECAVTVVSFSSDLELPVGEVVCQAEGEEVINNSAVQCQMPVQSNATAEFACVSVSGEIEIKGKSKRTYRRTKSGPARSGGKKDVSSSRNPPSPVFVALQNKFEVLSSGNSVDRSKSVAYLDGTAPLVDSSVKELNFDDMSVDDAVQVDASECGTDVSPLPEFPDKYEVGQEIVLEVGYLGNNSFAVTDFLDNASNTSNNNPEKEDSSFELQVLEHEISADGDECLTNLIFAEDAPHVNHKLEELTTSDMPSQMDISVDAVEGDGCLTNLTLAEDLPQVDHKLEKRTSPDTQSQMDISTEHDESLTNSVLAEDASQVDAQLEELTVPDMQSRGETSVGLVEDDECLTSSILSAYASPMDHQLEEPTTGQMEVLTNPVEGDDCLTKSVFIEEALQVEHQLEELTTLNSGPSTSQMKVSVDTVEGDACLTSSILSTDASHVDHQQELTTFVMPSQREISAEPPESQRTVGTSHVIEAERLVEVDICLANEVQHENLQEPTASNNQSRTDISVDLQVYKSPPERTRRSRKIAMECHETSFVQLSANDDNLPSRKQRLQLLSKSSPSTPNNNPGGRSGTGDVYSSSRTGTRRNSFGMAKSDHITGEGRLCGSDSIPSYMRATESTKAKFHSNSSPRSSSDVLDKESYLKKRQSFPIADTKYESSPRMQRSSSQKQQSRKGKATHSPQGSAERRWQR